MPFADACSGSGKWGGKGGAAFEENPSLWNTKWSKVGVCSQQPTLKQALGTHITVFAGGRCDPMTGVTLERTVILRPHLALQREIAAWCLQHHIPYAPREWTHGPTESVVKNTTFGRRLCRALKTVGKALTAKSPSYPSEAYHFAGR